VILEALQALRRGDWWKPVRPGCDSRQVFSATWPTQPNDWRLLALVSGLLAGGFAGFAWLGQQFNLTTKHRKKIVSRAFGL